MSADAMRARIADVALAFYRRHGAPSSNPMRYGMHRPYPPSLNAPEALRGGRIDCSSFVTLVYKDAGAPDPNGRGFDGFGYTGSLWNNGDPVRGGVLPGDLAFYGSPTQAGAAAHVVVIVDTSGACVSFGGTPCRYWSTYRYRSDFVGVRRYDVGTAEPERLYYLERMPWNAHPKGTGPKVNGPWLDERDLPDERKWPGARRLFAQMQANGRAVSLRTKCNRAWILDHLPGTHGDRLRWGPWEQESFMVAAREALTPTYGLLRPYVGAANSVYRML